MGARGGIISVACGFVTILLAGVHPGHLHAQAKAKPATVKQVVSEAVEAGSVDLARSRVYIFVGKKGRLGHEHGVIGKLKSGQVTLGGAKGAGELVIDMTSFLADTKEARKYVGLDGENDASTQQQVTQNMLSGNVLDAKQYPTATFTITSAQRVKSAKPEDPVRYQLDGKFTLHGVSQPLAIIALAEEFEGKTRLRGDFTILQTNYGIRPYSKAFGAVGVSNELKIWGDLLLNK